MKIFRVILAIALASVASADCTPANTEYEKGTRCCSGSPHNVAPRETPCSCSAKCALGKSKSNGTGE
ncbi:hypothetical protein N7492_010185 [Penicillium capsulatum]|uniref:Uncharacterized protein n=1 Tax=Penicillium capsulatum TaxID=69766 RepID=A0A9W9HNA5_9EURO|nr:hypothetical protein N7492_010185 [Penicillium capsulatum]KAJ6112693.1 hypothetical protein N7512_008017 [Penicillium capsulatum]